MEKIQWVCLPCAKRGVEHENDARKTGKPCIRRADKGRHAVLVAPKDEEDRKQIDEKKAKAAKMEVEIADARAKGDMRALTELEVTLAVSCLLRGEAIDPATRRKCEKDHYRLHGIEI